MYKSWKRKIRKGSCYDIKKLKKNSHNNLIRDMYVNSVYFTYMLYHKGGSSKKELETLDKIYAKKHPVEFVELQEIKKNHPEFFEAGVV